jgi:hypothetical protein
MIRYDPERFGRQNGGHLGSRRELPVKALNARFVATVEEPGKCFDGSGLFLRLQDSGSKQWVQRITIRGKRCVLGLGSPPPVSLAETRDQAFENGKTARAGGETTHLSAPFTMITRESSDTRRHRG